MVMVMVDGGNWVWEEGRRLARFFEGVDEYLGRKVLCSNRYGESSPRVYVGGYTLQGS
jgi:hypothetical protein